MLERIIHFIKGPNLFHPNVWKGRLQPTTFRLLAPSDLTRCLELYTQNEPNRFPQNRLAHDRTDLEKETSCTIVGERGRRVLASAGISKLYWDNLLVLSFGLVDPEHQGRGLGIAMTLARLAMIEPNHSAFYVLIMA